MVSSFSCDRCGQCCRHIGGILQLRPYDRGDGVCCHLTDGNLCDIYDSRPEVCSVDRMYVRFAGELTREQYDALMMKSCECLKKGFAGEDSFDLAATVVSEASDKVLDCLRRIQSF